MLVETQLVVAHQNLVSKVKQFEARRSQILSAEGGAIDSVLESKTLLKQANTINAELLALTQLVALIEPVLKAKQEFEAENNTESSSERLKNLYQDYFRSITAALKKMSDLIKEVPSLPQLSAKDDFSNILYLITTLRLQEFSNNIKRELQPLFRGRHQRSLDVNIDGLFKLVSRVLTTPLDDPRFSKLALIAGIFKNPINLKHLVHLSAQLRPFPSSSFPFDLCMKLNLINENNKLIQRLEQDKNQLSISELIGLIYEEESEFNESEVKSTLTFETVIKYLAEVILRLVSLLPMPNIEPKPGETSSCKKQAGGSSMFAPPKGEKDAGQFDALSHNPDGNEVSTQGEKRPTSRKPSNTRGENPKRAKSSF